MKEILSSTKTKVMSLINEKQVLTTQLNEQKQIAAQFAESYRLNYKKTNNFKKKSLSTKAK